MKHTKKLTQAEVLTELLDDKAVSISQNVCDTCKISIGEDYKCPNCSAFAARALKEKYAAMFNITENNKLNTIVGITQAIIDAIPTARLYIPADELIEFNNNLYEVTILLKSIKDL